MNAILPEKGNRAPSDSRVEIIRFSQGICEGDLHIRKNDRGEPCEVTFQVNDAAVGSELKREIDWLNVELRHGRKIGAILLPKAERGEDPRRLRLFALLARMLIVRFPSAQ